MTFISSRTAAAHTARTHLRTVLLVWRYGVYVYTRRRVCLLRFALVSALAGRGLAFLTRITRAAFSAAFAFGPHLFLANALVFLPRCYITTRVVCLPLGLLRYVCRFTRSQPRRSHAFISSRLDGSLICGCISHTFYVRLRLVCTRSSTRYVTRLLRFTWHAFVRLRSATSCGSAFPPHGIAHRLVALRFARTLALSTIAAHNPHAFTFTTSCLVSRPRVRFTRTRRLRTRITRFTRSAPRTFDRCALLCRTFTGSFNNHLHRTFTLVWTVFPSPLRINTHAFARLVSLDTRGLQILHTRRLLPRHATPPGLRFATCLSFYSIIYDLRVPSRLLVAVFFGCRPRYTLVPAFWTTASHGFRSRDAVWVVAVPSWLHHSVTAVFFSYTPLFTFPFPLPCHSLHTFGLR